MKRTSFYNLQAKVNKEEQGEGSDECISKQTLLLLSSSVDKKQFVCLYFSNEI